MDDPVPPRLTLADFDFELPPELIAQVPAPERSGSRLLHVRRDGFDDRQFRDLPSLLRAGDLLVLNDTRVVKSRLAARKPTGGAVELLLERVLGASDAQFQVRASHAPRPGSVLLLDGGRHAEVVARSDRFFHLRLGDGEDWLDHLDRFGALPLPPYIQRAAAAADDDRYQTVYSRHPGAVAAPTAGLHFDPPMLDRLRKLGVATATVTLHVGSGTFLPVQADDIAAHRMHVERYSIPEATVAAIAATRERRGRVVAVGTTSLRALESAAGVDDSPRPGPGETSLFVTPGYRFRIVDRLITNFHLPRSTLLMLVSAFSGLDRIRLAYAYAIAARYRFFSYGDAMFLEPDPASRDRAD